MVHRFPFGLTRRLWVTTVVAGLACAPEQPVTWQAEQRADGIIAPGAVVRLEDGGIPTVQLPPPPLRWPDDSAACPNTWAVASAGGDSVIAAWWSAAARGEPVLRSAWSANGGIDWGDPVTIGVAAPSSGGCRRAPPGVNVDAGTGSALAVYDGQVGDSAGVALVRGLKAGREPRPAQLIVSGRGSGRAAVAAAGDTAVVAYEFTDANGNAIWLAISLGSDHIPVVIGAVNGGGNSPFAPIVAVRNGQVAVAWNEARRGSDGPFVVVRVGRLNPGVPH